MDLTKAEDIKKRQQEYTEELRKKALYDTDNNGGVITHLEPDILECEIKWALEIITTNKASEGDGIPVQFSSVQSSCSVMSDSLKGKLKPCVANQEPDAPLRSDFFAPTYLATNLPI